MKTLTARRVRRSRRMIAREVRREGRCPSLAIRHHWIGPMGGIWYRCRNCGELT